MITTFIISAVLACLDALLSLLPDWEMPVISGGSSELWGITELNRIIPILVVINVLLLSVSLRILITTFGLVQWVYHQFWGSS